MDMQTESQVQGLSSEIARLVREQVDAYLQEKEAEKETRTPRLAMIATKGTLDWAYPPLILATTAAALGWEVGIFFTFYGLNIIHKEKSKHLRGCAPGESCHAHACSEHRWRDSGHDGDGYDGHEGHV